MIQLTMYKNEKAELANLIKRFWMAHNDYTPTEEEAQEDCEAWTGGGHRTYFICKDDEVVGFMHLASRGCEIDWLEDLFILPEYQGRGYGAEALKLAEDIVKEYSDSLYMEVAARNDKALKLYYRQGYDILNTITIRKDFEPEKYRKIGQETVFGHMFQVKNMEVVLNDTSNDQ